MATYSAAFAELLEQDQKDIFLRRYAMIPEKRFELFERKQSNKSYEDGLRVAGLGRVKEKPEGTPIIFDDPVIGTKVRTTHTTYGLGWRATMEMLQDELFGVMDQMTGELADSVADHQERLAWSLIDDAFTGAEFTGLQGETLFSTTHANLKLGGTQANMLDPAVALGTTGIEAILTMAETTTGDEGRFIDLETATMVIHPNLRWTANVLFDTEYEVNSSNNNINTVSRNRIGLKVIRIPYLSSQTAWTIHAPVGNNSLTWNDRMAVEFSQAGDPDTKDLKHYVCYRASVMTREWRGNFGSNA